MTYRVKALRKAEGDVRSIVAYVRKRSSRGAVSWLDAYRAAREHLAEFADGCGEAEENHQFEFDVRQHLFKTRRGRVYRMLFTMIGDEVRILRVRGSGQAPVDPGDV